MRISNFLRYMDGPGGRRSQNGKIQVRFFSDFSEQIKTKKVLEENWRCRQIIEESFAIFREWIWKV